MLIKRFLFCSFIFSNLSISSFWHCCNETKTIDTSFKYEKPEIHVTPPTQTSASTPHESVTNKNPVSITDKKNSTETFTPRNANTTSLVVYSEIINNKNSIATTTQEASTSYNQSNDEPTTNSSQTKNQNCDFLNNFLNQNINHNDQAQNQSNDDDDNKTEIQRSNSSVESFGVRTVKTRLVRKKDNNESSGYNSLTFDAPHQPSGHTTAYQYEIQNRRHSLSVFKNKPQEERDKPILSFSPLNSNDYISPNQNNSSNTVLPNAIPDNQTESRSLNNNHPELQRELTPEAIILLLHFNNNNHPEPEKK